MDHSKDQKHGAAVGEVPLLRDTAGAPVGHFHVGRQVGGRPVAVSSWRITTGDRDVADALAGLYGGQPGLTGEGAGRGYEVLTRGESVSVVLTGGQPVAVRMVMRAAGEVFHVCDGVNLLDSTGAEGGPCGCPATVEERKAAARAGRGPVPEVRLRFRLAGLPDVGIFQLVSTSWELLESLPSAERVMHGTSVDCVLSYQLVEFTTGSGILVSYRRPVLEVKGRRVGRRGDVCLVA
ncbi:MULTISPECIES: hypothetical protein [unclassified Streptomyces]|uniref:recombination directionality factor n=1 Tax=unclassified Streptomyces TaxID=2593676 RepID=UPI002DD86510|nr:hypothetical protein [Streptomyces sp. NBC_01795]WSA91629.1 hypothetical protein OIE63_08685 [Streptomyces sp. NBC_01795]WSS44564.1 hypothetical protein OG220_31230 [Streptomyces sp. NBC_01187]